MIRKNGNIIKHIDIREIYPVAWGCMHTVGLDCHERLITNPRTLHTHTSGDAIGLSVALEAMGWRRGAPAAFKGRAG